MELGNALTKLYSNSTHLISSRNYLNPNYLTDADFRFNNRAHLRRIRFTLNRVLIVNYLDVVFRTDSPPPLLSLSLLTTDYRCIRTRRRALNEANEVVFVQLRFDAQTNYINYRHCDRWRGTKNLSELNSYFCARPIKSTYSKNQYLAPPPSSFKLSIR